jgi:hypothetical protein
VLQKELNLIQKVANLKSDFELCQWTLLLAARQNSIPRFQVPTDKQFIARTLLES